MLVKKTLDGQREIFRDNPHPTPATHTHFPQV